jgi:hypothetical protein
MLATSEGQQGARRIGAACRYENGLDHGNASGVFMTEGGCQPLWFLSKLLGCHHGDLANGSE